MGYMGYRGLGVKRLVDMSSSVIHTAHSQTGYGLQNGLPTPPRVIIKHTLSPTKLQCRYVGFLSFLQKVLQSNNCVEIVMALGGMVVAFNYRQIPGTLQLNHRAEVLACSGRRGIKVPVILKFRPPVLIV